MDLAFREGRTFSWSHGDSSLQIHAWVVRDSTVAATSDEPMAGTIQPQVYRVSECDASIAIVRLLPKDSPGW